VPVVTPDDVVIDPYAVLTPEPVGPDALGVRISGPPGALTAVEVVCPGGFRGRSPIHAAAGGSMGLATVDGLPTGERCTLHFKGGQPARFSPVDAGAAILCDIIGATATCRPDQPVSAEWEVDPDLLRLRFPPGSSPESVSVSCPGGLRQWSPLIAGRAERSGLPSRTSCRAEFQPGGATYTPIHAGMLVDCVRSTAGVSCGHQLAQRAATPQPVPAPVGGGRCVAERRPRCSRS